MNIGAGRDTMHPKDDARKNNVGYQLSTTTGSTLLARPTSIISTGSTQKQFLIKDPFYTVFFTFK